MQPFRSQIHWATCDFCSTESALHVFFPDYTLSFYSVHNVLSGLSPEMMRSGRSGKGTVPKVLLQSSRLNQSFWMKQDLRVRWLTGLRSAHEIPQCGQPASYRENSSFQSAFHACRLIDPSLARTFPWARSCAKYMCTGGCSSAPHCLLTLLINVDYAGTDMSIRMVPVMSCARATLFYC